jgi:hypothetical protein
MFRKFFQRLRRKKLFRLRVELAGRKAALQSLRESGYHNYAIAEDIARLEFQIAELESRQ